MREITITDPNPPKDLRLSPEKVLLLVTYGDADSWGEFEPLRGTSWEAGVRVVSAVAYSDALHGRILPLQRELGRNPQYNGRRVTEEEGECGLSNECALYQKGFCQPAGKTNRKKDGWGPPECYEPPLLDEGAALRELFRSVALAWKEGRHTIVVVGEGFNFR